MAGEENKPKLDISSSYIATIRNSPGSLIFRNRYFWIDGKSTDVLENGDLSCAMFVTSILYPFNLIKEIHTTVVGTIEDIKESGWYEIKEPKEGALMHWGFKKKDEGTQGKHHHVGFYLDSENAVSNDSPTGTVLQHHPTYGTFENGEARRDILAFYWHLLLDL